jgi:hypothetical protein
MSLEEVFCDEPMVSQSEALAEIVKHGHEPIEFMAELGTLPEYNGRAVLEWLGY